MTDKILLEAYNTIKEIEESEDPFCVNEMDDEEMSDDDFWAPQPAEVNTEVLELAHKALEDAVYAMQTSSDDNLQAEIAQCQEALEQLGQFL